MWQALGNERALLLICCAAVAGLLVVVVCGLQGKLVFGPLRRRAGNLHTPKQFQLSDFFWLVVQLQVVLVYSVRSVGVEQLEYFLTVFGFLLMATVGMWAGAMSFLSRAGVMQPLRRAVFILLLLPLTLALMIGTSFLVVIMPASLVVDRVIGQGLFALYVGTSELLRSGPFNLALLAVGLAVATWGLRRTALWVLEETSAPPLNDPFQDSGDTSSGARVDSTVGPLG